MTRGASILGPLLVVTACGASVLRGQVTAPHQYVAPALCANELERRPNQPPLLKRWQLVPEGSAGATFKLEDLALAAAPILWFSDGEPLLWREVSATASADWESAPKTPQALPCDPRGVEAPIVYYRLDALRVRKALTDDQHKQVPQGFIPLDLADRLRISYFFYYPKDRGLNPHIHDLETVSMEINIVRNKEGTLASAELDRVTGSAHGSDLLANILQVKPSVRNRTGATDVRVPVTILVEEGKHASCPDRNADGVYTPGIDVNVRVADAWGVRDVFGGGVVGSRYQSFMTKGRTRPLANTGDEPVGVDRYRIGPNLDGENELRCRYEQESLLNGSIGFPPATYELRDIRGVGACENLPRPNNLTTGEPIKWTDVGHIFEAECLPADETESMKMKGDKKVCQYLNLFESVAGLRPPPPITRIKLTYKYGSWWPIQPFRNAFVGLRYDRGAKGLTAGFFSAYGLPKFGGWFNAGATAVRRDDHWDWATNLWFTPSIATLATWYVGLGYDHRNAAIADRTGHFAFEGGVQLRHSAVGLRLGLRSTLSGGGFRNAGLVSEIVFGPAPKGTRVH